MHTAETAPHATGHSVAFDTTRLDAWRRRCFEIVELSSPGDRTSKIFDLFLVAVIIINITAIVFESVPKFAWRYTDLFYWLEAMTTLVFSIEYVLRLWSSTELKRFRKPPAAAWKRRLIYSLSFMAIVDLLAVLPFFLFHLGLFSVQELSLLKTLRLLRVFKLTRYSQTMILLQQVLKDNRQIFTATLAILLVLMLIAACGIYLFERDAQPIAFGSIPAAMWWSFATLTTVGYGDVTPITVGGRIFGAGITVLSIGMVALPAGILASSFSQQLRNRERAFESVARHAYADGHLSAREQQQLEAFRIKMGLNKTNAKLILKQFREHRSGDRCPHCGQRYARETTATHRFP